MLFYPISFTDRSDPLLYGWNGEHMWHLLICGILKNFLTFILAVGEELSRNFRECLW